MKIAIGSSAKNHQKILGLYRITKAASHKLPGKSSLNVCPVCPVCQGLGIKNYVLDPNSDVENENFLTDFLGKFEQKTQKSIFSSELVKT